MSSLTANINNIKAELQENLKNVKTDFQVQLMMTHVVMMMVTSEFCKPRFDGCQKLYSLKIFCRTSAVQARGSWRRTSLSSTRP